MSHDVIIIGAGLAGLSCALRLQEQGIPFLVCEASHRVGGRVATDVVDGYRLDRGFQVLLTDYPEAQRCLDYDALDLRAFYPGALVRFNGAWHRMADPLRHPLDALRGALHPIGTFRDKMRTALLRLRGFDFSRHGSHLSAFEALQKEGFSESMIQRFFRPFLGGVFLENGLDTTVAKLDFVMNHFSRGDTVIPAKGMAEIPLQLAKRLPEESVLRDTRVVAIEENGIRLASGEWLRARAIVVATEAGALSIPDAPPAPDFHRVSCLYFSADHAPLKEPVLFLNGDATGPINNLVVLSNLSRELAPEGKHLLSVSVVDSSSVDDPDLVDHVRAQLREWFGDAANSWHLLRQERICRAVPVQHCLPDSPIRLGRGRYQCGDHLGVASIDTALASGRKAADAVIEDLLLC
jgi:phytoene dehydrogenase-like protein